MRHSIGICCLVVAVALSVPAFAQSPQWVLTWSDEFNGTTPDPAVWNVENSTTNSYGGTMQAWRPANVVLQNGILRLIAKRESSGGREYTSGAVNTRLKKTFGPEFRLEVRANIPAFRGGWPAIWTREGLMPNPDVGVEIDVMENIGDPNVVYQVQHTWGINGSSHEQILSCAPYQQSFAGQMHVYAVEVVGGQTRWYIDGQPSCGPSNVTPEQASHLLLNLSIGGSWPGSPDGAGAFPQYFDIDYVRVYERGSSAPPADMTNPTVSLTAPSGGTVSGTVSLAATATDNTGVTGVWFTVDGATIGAEDTSTPYQRSWNTTTVANGSHTVRALARDAAGNTTTSAPVTVTVSNGGAADSTAPAISLTAPAASATISGQVTVSASASDNVGVATVQFTLNGTNLGAADSSSPYSLSWDTRGAANGLYTLRAVARDAAGNTTTSAARNVTVNNVSSDTSRPSVSLTAPSSGATIANTVTVSASASDNVGVTAVQFTLNGVNLGSPDTSAPYAISWNTRGAANGTHMLRAIARDAAGNTRTSSSRYVTVRNTTTTTPPSTPPSSTPPPTTPPPSTAHTCATPDPFAAMGGGTCYNGGWLPPGMTPPTSGNSPSAPSAPAAPSAPSTPSACTSLRPGAGWTCYNGGWLPPGMTPPTAAAQPPSNVPAAPAGPSSAAPCMSVRPAADWVCHNGGWLPPGMALPTSGSGTTSPSTSVPSAPATCTSPQPGAGWACHNGGWLPPGMLPPQAPVLPTSPSSPAGCLTPRPGSDWVCSNGGWLPPNFPGITQ